MSTLHRQDDCISKLERKTCQSPSAPLCVIGGVEARSRKRYGGFSLVFASNGNSGVDPVADVWQAVGMDQTV